jgi:hemerythrin
MIEWIDEMYVGIAEFDNHHKRIIYLIAGSNLDADKGAMFDAD